MHDMNTFSTIIPCFNRQNYIAATIDSVLAQGEPNEIIVVDDGSTDDSIKIVEGYGERVKVLRQKNRGPGAARNLGAIVATGDYLCFLDSDDVWFPWTLQTYRKLIEMHDRPSVIGTDPMPFTEEASLKMAHDEPVVATIYPDVLARPTSWLQPSGMAVRRDVFEAVRGFTESHSEDADFLLRLGVSPGCVSASRPLCFGYRMHPGGISNQPSVKADIERLIDEEQADHYPGGAERRPARWAYISMHMRATSLFYLRGGLRGRALRLYGRTFWWNVRLGRWKYLLGFPAIVLASFLRRSRSGPRQSV